jgi:hypothetical protein
VGDGRDRGEVAADELGRVEPRVEGRVGVEVSVHREGTLDAPLAVQQGEPVEERRRELDGLAAARLEHRVERAGGVDAEGACDVLRDRRGELGGLVVGRFDWAVFSFAPPHSIPIRPALRGPLTDCAQPFAIAFRCSESVGASSMTWLTEPSWSK